MEFDCVFARVTSRRAKHIGHRWKLEVRGNAQRTAQPAMSRVLRHGCVRVELTSTNLDRLRAADPNDATCGYAGRRTDRNNRIHAAHGYVLRDASRDSTSP